MKNLIAFLSLTVLVASAHAATPAQRVRYDITQSTMGITVLSVTGDGASSPFRIELATGTSDAQRRTAEYIAGTVDISTSSLTALDVIFSQAGEESIFSQGRSSAEIDKALMLAVLAENNNLRSWVMSFKAAVAAAGSLAALKTGVAALPDTPDRTASQLRAAIKSRLEGN